MHSLSIPGAALLFFQASLHGARVHLLVPGLLGEMVRGRAVVGWWSPWWTFRPEVASSLFLYDFMGYAWDTEGERKDACQLLRPTGGAYRMGLRHGVGGPRDLSGHGAP